MSKPEQRFAIDQPLRIRRGSEEHWRPAFTVNVSRTGLLFTCDGPLNVGDEVELYIVIHDFRGHELPPVTRTFGRVVRLVAAPRGAAIEFTGEAYAAAG